MAPERLHNALHERDQPEKRDIEGQTLCLLELDDGQGLSIILCRRQNGWELLPKAKLPVHCTLVGRFPEWHGRRIELLDAHEHLLHFHLIAPNLLQPFLQRLEQLDYHR